MIHQIFAVTILTGAKNRPGGENPEYRGPLSMTGPGTVSQTRQIPSCHFRQRGIFSNYCYV